MPFRKVRGYQKAIREMAQEVLTLAEDGMPLGVIHACSPQEAKRLREFLRQELPGEREIFLTEINPHPSAPISVREPWEWHTGSGTDRSGFLKEETYGTAADAGSGMDPSGGASGRRIFHLQRPAFYLFHKRRRNFYQPQKQDHYPQHLF